MPTKSIPRPLIEYVIPTFVFIILTVYSYAKVLEIPYIGFDFNPRSGKVIEIFTRDTASQVLQTDDRLVQVDEVHWETFNKNKRQPLFNRVRPGDAVNIRVFRNGQEISLRWVIPGPSLAEIIDRLSTLWLPYLFWVAGTATLFHIRPRDIRWRLLIAFHYLTALWLMTGLVSSGAIWQSAILLRALIWLCVPVYLHLHWVFPRRLGRIPPPVWLFLYLLAGVMAGLEWFQVIPPSSYSYGVALGFGGSLALLVAHAISQPEQRGDLKVLGVAAGVIIIPTLVIGAGVASMLNNTLWFGWGALLSLPAFPGSYFYVIYRRQLGGLELRANRIISLYIFLVLLFIVSTLVVFGLNVWDIDPGVIIAIEVALTLLAGVAIATYYSNFQRWVEKAVLGIPLPPSHLVETYSTRITTSLNPDSLVHLLRDEILPSLLVRQSALLWLKENGSFSSLYVDGVDENQLPSVSDSITLVEKSGEYLFFSNSADNNEFYPWIRLILSLRIEENLIGFWLLGRRDPDDWYDQRVISVLQSIANQTAIALVNITQAERLRALYRANIDRQENERARLARIIHDNVLNNLALLTLSQDRQDQMQQIQESFQKIGDDLREIIQNLRPALLSYGLRPALDELVEELSERTEDSLSIHLDIPPTGVRYDAHFEQHMYRIIQQACENAIRHARAKTILVQGNLKQTRALVSVVDDGIGFPDGKVPSLNQLLMDRHFGLVGMYERAALIGAELKIHSAPGEYTKITVNWELDAG